MSRWNDVVSNYLTLPNLSLAAGSPSIFLNSSSGGGAEMNAKRSNNAIWKLVVPDGVTPKKRLAGIIAAYAELVTEESNYKPLTVIPLNQSIPKVRLDLYVRSSFSQGLCPFVEGYLQQPDDGKKFYIHGADACLFLATESSLFAVTSGGGYHIHGCFKIDNAGAGGRRVGVER